MIRRLSNVLAGAALAVSLLTPSYAQGNPDCAAHLGTILVPLVRPFALTVPCVTLVGTWEVAVSPDGIPGFTAYNVFSADGNSVEFDNSNPPSQQTIAAGPWKKTGELQYAMVEVNQLFDPQGNFAGRLRVKATIKLDPSGETFSSKFEFTVTDPSGAVVFQGTGTAAGKRVTFD